MELQDFAVDPETSENGKWIQVSDDCEWLVARFGNKKCQEALKRLQKPYKSIIDAKALPADVWDKMLIEALSTTVWLGWRGKFTIKGEDVGEYSSAKAKELLSNPTLPIVKQYVLKYAEDMDTFAAEEVAEKGKNSEGTSAGGKLTAAK